MLLTCCLVLGASRAGICKLYSQEFRHGIADLLEHLVCAKAPYTELQNNRARDPSMGGHSHKKTHQSNWDQVHAVIGR